MTTQVSREHYQKRGYDDLTRWMSYDYQLKAILDSDSHKILEVGIGNGLVSDYLRKQGLSVKTCDFDASLNPDVVADIRKLPFEDDEYDMVCACQVLEHLPWEESKKALLELKRVSRQYVLISLPYHSIRFDCVLRFQKIRQLLGREVIDLSVRIPRLTKLQFIGEHYWEIGSKGYPLRKIRRELRGHFSILKEFSPVLNKYHEFFFLEVRD